MLATRPKYQRDSGDVVHAASENYNPSTVDTSERCGQTALPHRIDSRMSNAFEVLWSMMHSVETLQKIDSFELLCSECKFLILFYLPPRFAYLYTQVHHSHILHACTSSTSITCQALLNRGSCLVMDLSCARSMRRAKLRLIKDMAKSRILIENKPGFYLRFRFAE